MNHHFESNGSKFVSVLKPNHPTSKGPTIVSKILASPALTPTGMPAPSLRRALTQAAASVNPAPVSPQIATSLKTTTTTRAAAMGSMQLSLSLMVKIQSKPKAHLNNKNQIQLLLMKKMLTQ